MAFLDIERIINTDNVGSRFKLVYLAGLRAKELNNPDDETYIAGYKNGQKVTSRALEDIVKGRITFEEYTDDKSNATSNENIEEK